MKSKIIAAMKDNDPSLTQGAAEKALNTVVAAVRSVLLTDREARLPGLGNFKVKFREGRTGRNPVTGEEIQIAAKDVVSFKAAKDVI